MWNDSLRGVSKLYTLFTLYLFMVDPLLVLLFLHWWKPCQVNGRQAERGTQTLPYPKGQSTQYIPNQACWLVQISIVLIIRYIICIYCLQWHFSCPVFFIYPFFWNSHINYYRSLVYCFGQNSYIVHQFHKFSFLIFLNLVPDSETFALKGCCYKSTL